MTDPFRYPGRGQGDPRDRPLDGETSEMQRQHPQARRKRARGARLFLVAALGLLGAGFFRAQIVSSENYRLRANSNVLRPLPVPAPRGTIYDRHGHVIADNVPGYAVSVLPAARDSVAATLERMREYLDLSDARIADLMEARDRAPRQLLLVTLDAGLDAVSALEERRHRFPNVFVEMRPKRRYNSGEAIAHLMGYIGEINAEELESERFADERYEQGMIVGKTGLERQYESMLQGRRGVRLVEVDAAGRIVGDFAGRPSQPVTPGEDLHLNIDLELQEWIHEIFPDTLGGAVVALDPADGGVLAMYSAPTYDPNAFVGGVSEDYYQGLLADVAGRPLFNRAVMGRYAPASTFKLATAAIALDLGLVTPEQTMEEPCDGDYFFGRTWRCWDAEGHGDVNLIEAIQHSCDVYFYQLGRMIGLDRFLQRSTEIGFGQRCGIDLPQESQGRFPTDRDWWIEPFGAPATEGEALNLAIGQGPNDQTPLKIAQFYLAVAGNGSVPPPRLRVGTAPTEEEGWRLDLSEAALDALREGARRVVADPGGTAHLRASLEHWDVAGKSGTGQNNLSVRGLAHDHAWFAGMAGPRGGDPEIVVVALVEYGESGSQMAAPIVAKAADFYLRRLHDMPIDTVQTMLEHILAGRPLWPEVSN